MRPALKSGLLPVWRDRDTIQIGIDPRRAVALSGMGRAAGVLGLLDGSRDRAQVVSAAVQRGIPAQLAERILTLLAAAGALDDFPASTLRKIAGPARARLAGELAAASLALGDGEGGARFLARRDAALVRIEGEPQIGAEIERILAAAGVGAVAGPDRSRAASRGTPAGPGGCQLVILVGRPGLERPDALVRARVPHLAVAAGEAIGVVGPMVVPGETACVRCLDQRRAALDPAWPLILAQLTARRPEPPACGAVLAAAVAAQAAAQALAALDTSPGATAAANGTLELALPDWRWRRRTWPSQPDCVCGSYQARPQPTDHTTR